MHRKIQTVLLSLSLGLLIGDIGWSAPAGTAFTYQGRLTDDGIVANGIFDLRFILYTADIGGSQVGTILTKPNVEVVNGVFLTDLDFGSEVLDGEARWLEIGVRTNGSTRVHTTLSPRQPLTPAPYAIFSSGASNLLGMLPDGRLSANVAKLNQNQSFTATPNFSPAVGAPFSVGSNAKVDNLNADFLDGFHAGNTESSLAVNNGLLNATLNADLLDGLHASTFAPTGHTHLAESWGGFTSLGLEVAARNANGIAVRGWSGNASTQDTHPAGEFANAAGEFAGNVGLIGAATSDTSDGYGVVGLAPGMGGRGVFGKATATSGSASGIYGQSAAPTGAGVVGWATGTNAANYGIYGQSDSGGGFGVYGRAAATAGTNSSGVYGVAMSANGNGVYGYAASNATNGVPYGVFGEAFSSVGYGVVGRGGAAGLSAQNSVNPTNYASLATPGYAGYFNGPVTIVGRLTKSGGSFQIDHPLDPANKTLSHSFVESPDMKNIYDGVVTLDTQGEAVIKLPAWFEALNQDFRYQLTAVGAPGPNLHVAEKISHNQFKIAGGPAGLEVSWQVTGIRHDAWANANRIQVEEAKSTTDRGAYLHPELFGQSRGVQRQLQPDRKAAPSDQKPVGVVR